MSLDESKLRIIRVTQTVDYIVEDVDASHRSLDDLIQEWFYDPKYPQDSFHAYRNGCQVGFSTKIISHRVMTLDELSQERKPVKAPT